MRAAAPLPNIPLVVLSHTIPPAEGEGVGPLSPYSHWSCETTLLVETTRLCIASRNPSPSPSAGAGAPPLG